MYQYSRIQCDPVSQIADWGDETVHGSTGNDSWGFCDWGKTQSILLCLIVTKVLSAQNGFQANRNLIHGSDSAESGMLCKYEAERKLDKEVTYY